MCTHIYLDKERFKIRRKKETPIICKKNYFSLDIQKSIVEIKKSISKNCARSLHEEENHGDKRVILFTEYDYYLSIFYIMTEFDIIILYKIYIKPSKKDNFIVPRNKKPGMFILFIR